MLTLFGDLDSGNVHKAQMILGRAGIAYRRVDVSQSRGEARSSEFRALNPIAKVPTVLFDDGDVLSESGAILYFFGRDTQLWPGDVRAQAEVLRWMFFEQYSHEPSVAVIRYLRHYAKDPASASRVAELEPKARQALGVMEGRLAGNDWIAGPACTIADFALYPYTRVMEDSGFDPRDYPAICRWFQSIEAQPGFIAMGQDGAAATMTWSEYLAECAGR